MVAPIKSQDARHMPYSPRNQSLSSWIPRLLVCAGTFFGVLAQAAPLPDELRLVIATPDGTQTLHLHKRTARAAACAIYRWSSVGGYAPVSPEVRTFRGTVEENGNAMVIASIGADQKLKAYCLDMEWGHNARWQVSGLDVSSQLALPDTQAAAMPAQTVGLPRSGTAGAPRIGPKVPTGTAPNGVPYGSIVEYELALDLTVAAYTRHGSDLDNVLAAYEADAMLYEWMMLRDLHVRVVVPTVVIRTGNFFAADPGNVNLSALQAAWTTAPLSTNAWDGVWASEGFYASGNGIGKEESSFAAGALYHENAHNWTAFHLAYQCDTMGGNKPSVGPMTVDTMLRKRKEAIDENKLPVAAPFPDPVHPHTYVDAARIRQNTPVTLDVLANDHDANGDTLVIHSHTTNTVAGGSVTLVNNQLLYTPPVGFVGKEILAYTVRDSSPMGLKTREAVHIEVVNDGLMARYEMEESAGSTAANSVPGGVAGDLNGADFTSGRVASPLGHGVRVNGFPDDNDIENGNWSGMLVGKGSVMPVPLNASRHATPFEEEYNRHSAFYDIMDGDYTFATWFRSDSYAGADFPGGFDMAYIASRWWHPETRVGWDLYAMNGTIGLHYRIFDGTTPIQSLSAPYPLVEGRWYHVAAVFDRTANQIRVGIDGEVVAVKSDAFASNGFIFNGRAPLALGAFSRDRYCYDDVRVYAKALSLEELRALHAMPGLGAPRLLENPATHTVYARKPFKQSLWANLWGGGIEPLSFQILSGPSWLGLDAQGYFFGAPSQSDGGVTPVVVKITDSNGVATAGTMNLRVVTAPTPALAHWRMNEGTGASVADSSGNGYAGTNAGATWAAGVADGGLAFDGIAGSVSCGNVPVAPRMSFAAWVKPADTSGNKGILGKSGSYAIKVSGTELVYTRPGVADYTSSNAGILAGVWQHVTVTVDGAQPNGVNFYRNGARVSQRTGSSPSSNANPVLMGTNQFNQRFKGALDEIQLFDRVLTAEEVAALHASNDPSVGDGWFAHWKFDEGAGQVAADSSGRGNTGTLDTGITWVAGRAGSAVAMTTTKRIDLGGKPGPAGDWTFAAWVQRKGNTSTATLVDSGTTVIKLEQYSNTHRVGVTRRGVADWSFNYTTPLNQWVHLTLSSGGGAIRLYVNGVLQDTLVVPLAMPFTTLGHATEGMNAWLDDVVVYERALNAWEVQNLHAGIVGPYFSLFYDAGTGGTLGGATRQVVRPGENGTPVSAMPAPGFQFVRWNDGSPANPRTDVNLGNHLNALAVFSSFTPPNLQVVAQPAGESLHMRINGTVGERYQIEWSPVYPPAGPWHVVTNLTPLATTPFLLTVPASGAKSFYRAALQP